MEEAADKGRKKTLLTKIKNEFEGLEAAARAVEELKKLK